MNQLSLYKVQQHYLSNLLKENNYEAKRHINNLFACSHHEQIQIIIENVQRKHLFPMLFKSEKY